MDLGEKIKTLRKERGLTLQQVGDFVGVGKSTVRKWESGEIKNMGRDKIALVARALSVDPAYLMGWEGEEVQKEESKPLSPLDEKWHMLSAGVEDLPDYRKQAMIGIVESAMAAFNEARNEKK